MCPDSIHPDTGKWYEEVEPWTLDLLLQCPVYDPQWVPCERAGKTPKKSAVSVPVAVISEDHAERINGIELPIAERKKMAVRYLESVPGTKQAGWCRPALHGVKPGWGDCLRVSSDRNPSRLNRVKTRRSKPPRFTPQSHKSSFHKSSYFQELLAVSWRSRL